MRKLASALICGRSPAYESAVFWVHIFFCILHVGFYFLSFRVANVCHVQYFSGSPKSLIVAKVVITKSRVHFYRAEQQSQRKSKKNTFTTFSSILTAIGIMGAYQYAVISEPPMFDGK